MMPRSSALTKFAREKARDYQRAARQAREVRATLVPEVEPNVGGAPSSAGWLRLLALIAVANAHWQTVGCY